jgi:hypothetical protein
VSRASHPGALFTRIQLNFIDAGSKEYLGEARRGIDLRESACHA